MKKLLLSYLLLFTLSPAVPAVESITLAIGDWEPYTSSREKKGKVLELLVQEAFELEDIHVEYKYFPWKRSFEYSRLGKFHGTFPWYRTKQREEDFYINNEPILIEKTVFFHLKDSKFDWSNFDDLKKYRIGGTVGYSITQVLENSGIDVEYVGKEDLNYRKILSSRIDVYPNALNVGYYQIEMLFDDSESTNFTHHPKPLNEKSYYMLFNKDLANVEELADKLDSGLRKLKDSGRYDAILSTFDSKIPDRKG
ncbi:substrate-binding periplasmic protein [Psychromonas aquimarina]|uniref:substrate-binding periplasmic protein n=1 Tax=Psychromonas aquimarina TaxID=444919 RepID=UPI000417DF06|nr:transporter substrate-binding domain-containing protein [Psychromonas aquimarina]